MGKKESLEVIKEFIKKLSKDFDIHEIIFFGSRADGREKNDSDIDLIIVSNDFEGKGFFERASKMYDYWDALISVDFLCYTIKEFERLKRRISIVSEALKSGIIVEI